MRTASLSGLMLISVYAQGQAGQATLPAITVKAPPPVMIVPPGEPAPQLCSIPLMEVQIPNGVDFKIKQIQPQPGATVPMLRVKPPAPACNQAKK